MLSHRVWFIPLLVIMLSAVACASDEAAATPDAAALIQQAIAAQPQGATPEDIAKAVQDAMAQQPGVTVQEVASAISSAMSAQPGVTEAQVASAIASALADRPGVTEAQVAAAIANELSARPGVTEAQVASAIADALSMSPGVTQEEVQEAIVSALAQVATAAPADAPTATEIDYGGILTYPVHDYPASFDLHWEGSYTMNQPIGPIYNKLIDQNFLGPSGSIIGDLAERWDNHPDNKGYTFYLQKFVRWNDGSPFTCADAKSSLEKMTNPNVSRRAASLEPFESASCSDSFTLEVRITRPDHIFFKALSDTRFSIQKKELNDAVLEVGQPRTGITKDPEKFLIGTGPFLFDRTTPGVDTWTKRNPDYWKKDAEGNLLPYIDGAHTVVMPDLSAIFAAFRARQLTMTGVARHLDPSQAKILEKSFPDAVIHLFPRNAFHELVFNVPKEPLSDKRVRQAFSLAIDKQGTILRSVEGWGALGAYIGPHLRPVALSEEELMNHPTFGEDMEARQAKARELLAEAGFPNGLELELWAWRGPLYDKGAIANAADLKLVGIDLTIRQVDTAQVLDLRRSGNFVLMSGGSSAGGDDDPASYLTRYQCKLIEIGSNPTRYCNPEFDKLYEAQIGEFDQAKRVEILHDMERILLEDVPDVRSYYWLQSMAIWNRVQGWKLGVGDQVTNFRNWETVWCKGGQCQ